MIDVSEETKTEWAKESAFKEITVSFPNVNIIFTNEDIVSESLELSEAIENEVNLTFTGCIASQFKVQIADITTNLKGEYVEVSARVGETENISLFKGFVDTQTIQNYVTGICEITAYDILYTLQNTDVAEWYNSLNWENAWSVKDFRDSLFTHLEIAQEITTLVNDDIEFTKQYVPVQLSALSVVKSICQINGVFGKIGRDGVFKYYTLPTTETSVENIEYYKSLDYQRFTTQPINRIVVRQSDQEVGVAYGNGKNTFIMQGNFFTYGLDDTDLMEIAENVYPQVSGRSYVPYESEIEGYPWIEAGDILTYKIFDYSTQTYSNMNFYVLSRVLKGIQALSDSQSADGDKDRSVFISDINLSIDTIKADLESIKSAVEQKTIKSYQAHNESTIYVGDTWTEILDFTPFNQFNEVVTDYVFEGSLILNVGTSEALSNDIYTISPVSVEVKFELNGNPTVYYPTQVYDDGTHTLTLNMQFTGLVEKTRTDLKVYMRMSGGEVTIYSENAIGYLWAQNLTELATEKIYVKTLPDIVNYMQGENLNLIGVEIYKVYNNGDETDITSSCIFSPANGDTLSDVGIQTVQVSYTEGEKTFETSFEISVVAFDFLRYVLYSETPTSYIITGLNIANITADNLHSLAIPNTYNEKTVYLDGEK